MAFETTSRSAQIRLMRGVALRSLASWPIDVASIRLLNHDFNTTFRVDTVDGARYALRLNVNSRRSLAQLTAETAWVGALGQESSVHVPTPMATRDGSYVGYADQSLIDRPMPMVLYSWLSGRDLGDSPTKTHMRAVGRLAATLHSQAESWALPPGAALNRFDHVLMDGVHRIHEPHPALTDQQYALVATAMQHVSGFLADAFLHATPHAIHGDLHGSNLKWHNGAIQVFDFDDCGLGLPVQDLAIASYYLRDDLASEAAFLEGYSGVRPLPNAPGDALYEAIVAGRNIVLLNDIIEHTSTEMRAIVPRYIANTVIKLRAYLDTGVYRHDVEGLLPLD